MTTADRTTPESPTPDHPLRMELTFDLPGTPEQVWQAIATAEGISAWFLPTDLEEREGGLVRFHMGETSSEGSVTGWDPHHRLEYVEPGWAELSGHDRDSVTPLVTEFLIESSSGGSCVMRVVSSAFGTGADWEEEFFGDMEKSWEPYFELLRIYLVEFPGQVATGFEADLQIDTARDSVWEAMRSSAGIERVGQQVELRGLTGSVRRIDDVGVLLTLDGSLPGYLGIFVMGGDAESFAMVKGWLFADGARAYVEREQAGWKGWLDSIAEELAPAPAKA
jgi:uncharacterized protein YndB with AHSA1/START domain